RALPGARSGGIKPPERTCCRSQLSLRLLEFYEDKRLGMPQAALQPPSKPVHPRCSSRSGAFAVAPSQCAQDVNDTTRKQLRRVDVSSTIHGVDSRCFKLRPCLSSLPDVRH